MKCFLLSILSTFLISPITFAKVTINKTTKRKPADADTEGRTANLVFRDFLNCDQSKNGQQDIRVMADCARPFFYSKVSIEQVRRYSEALVFPNKYSELFYCDEKMSKMVQTFEDKNYDFFLCFESNIMAPSMRTGVVLFKRERKAPRILRLKM